jgi:hypothetical protein
MINVKTPMNVFVAGGAAPISCERGSYADRFLDGQEGQ